MARRKAHIPLNVLVNGRSIGRLTRQANGAIDFAYAQDWLIWENAFPVSLSLPLREDRYAGDPVIAVFDNLLPDNAQIRRRLAERVEAEGDDPYSLLARIGRDCIGALQFLPDGEDAGPVGKVSGRVVSDEEIAGLLADLKRTPLGVGESEEFRISLAGAQEKTALLYSDGRWQIPHGTTATTHIFKPEIGKLPNGIDFSHSIENEHLCMKLAAAFGIPTAETQMLEFVGKRALVVERFDRIWEAERRLLRVPQEDCCQSLSVPPTQKYESDGGPGMNAILDLLKASDQPQIDQRQFLKAQILFWLLGATDGHAKNFSLFLAPGGRFHLTPLYDVMSTQPAFDAGQLNQNRMKLAMAVGKNRHYTIHSIAPRHFIQTGAAFGMSAPSIHAVLDEMAAHADQAIKSVMQNLPGNFPEAIFASITNGLRNRLRLVGKI